jgi:hypothetical protein
MKKILVNLNEAEEQIIFHALNRLRTDLISEGRYTDVADELIMKIANSPIKKIRIV